MSHYFCFLFDAAKESDADESSEISSHGGVSVEDIVRKTAHQLQNLIFRCHKLVIFHLLLATSSVLGPSLTFFLLCESRCEWKGEACSMNDFKTSVTDFGICYTFNADYPGLTVNKTGNKASSWNHCRPANVTLNLLPSWKFSLQQLPITYFVAVYDAPGLTQLFKTLFQAFELC